MSHYKLNNYTKTKIWRFLKTLLITMCIGSITVLSFGYGYYNGSNSEYRRYDYTKLPNSCFLEAMIHASRASLVLKSEVDTKIFSSIFGYTFKYKDDVQINGKKQAATFGHAICIFEYKNKLWVYDMNEGTMYVGPAGNKNNYNEVIKEWAEKTYKIKIEKSFVIDDWALPADITDH